MSDYLTPRQVEVYERLIKKLLQQPHSVWNSRNDWSEAEWEQLRNIILEQTSDPYTKEGLSCSWMASHLRILICKSNDLLHKNALTMNDIKETAQQLTGVPSMETSSGLEQQCTMDKSIATVYALVNSLAATDSLYSILLKIYDHPDVACRGTENLWMMDIHIGNAMRNYAAQERLNIVNFLKGFPQQSEPGNDF